MLFFLTPNGYKYSQVYRKIREAIILNGLKDFVPPPPTCTEYFYQLKQLGI